MALTILKQPYQFTPANNPIHYQVKTDNYNIVFFKVEIKEAVTSNVIQVLKLYPSPADQMGGFIDVSKILNNYVKHQFKNYNTNYIDSFTSNILAYTLKITEMWIGYTTGGSSIVEGAIYQTPTPYYVFYGELDKIFFRNYKQEDYVITATKVIKFLTNKPDKVKVNEYSNEGLCFLQNNYNKAIKAKYAFFNSDNGAVISNEQTVNSTEQTNKKLFRINVSPKKLKSLLSTSDWNSVSYYTVTLVDEDDVVLSETRTYLIEKLTCNLKPINVVWVNKFGCLETYQFINPERNLNVSKTTVGLNPYRYNTAGVYVDFNEDAFNVIDSVISTNTEMTIKLWTRVLKDNKMTWISELLNTKQAWLQADGDLFIPVLVNDSSITLSEQRYLTEPNVKQITFKLSDGFRF